MVHVPSVHLVTLAFIRVLYGSAYLIDPLFFYLKTEMSQPMTGLTYLVLRCLKKKILPHWIIYCSRQYW